MTKDKDTSEVNEDVTPAEPEQYIEHLHEKNHGLFQASEGNEKHIKSTTLRIADGLEFEVDQRLAAFIEACWKSGIFIVQSETWSNALTVRLQIASPAFADQLLANMFTDGDIYWDSGEQLQMLGQWNEVDAYTKVIPEDWEWSLSHEGEIDEPTAGLIDATAAYLGKTKEEMESDMYWKIDEKLVPEPSVIVRFPQEFLELLTERLVSKKTDRPEPDGLIWMLLPEMDGPEDEMGDWEKDLIRSI